MKNWRKNVLLIPRNMWELLFASVFLVCSRAIFFMARDKVIYGLQKSSVNPHLLYCRTKPIHPYSSSFFFIPMSTLEVINFLSLFQTPNHLARLLSQFPTKSCRSNSSNVRVFESSPDLWKMLFVLYFSLDLKCNAYVRTIEGYRLKCILSRVRTSSRSWRNWRIYRITKQMDKGRRSKKDLAKREHLEIFQNIFIAIETVK